jgi:hypothetical protein
MVAVVWGLERGLTDGGIFNVTRGLGKIKTARRNWKDPFNVELHVRNEVNTAYLPRSHQIIECEWEEVGGGTCIQQG